MFKREMRMMTTGRVKRKRMMKAIMMKPRERLPKIEGEEDDEDDAQFIDTDPVPPKHWTQSQQAQQDEKESSLVKEILSDDEKQQKSWMKVQKASKESASPFDGQPSSQGEGSEPVPEEADLQDPGNKDESAVKEVTKLNTKNKVQNESPVRGSGCMLCSRQTLHTEG